MVDSDLDADCGGKRCDNGLTDELDEEAEVEDPAEDLDDPGEESESDCLVRAATGIVERHDGVNSGRPNSGLPAKQGRLGMCVAHGV